MITHYLPIYTRTHIIRHVVNLEEKTTYRVKAFPKS